MQKATELTYINRLSLPRLKRVQSGYVCSCVKCNEGSSPWKTRLYILTENKSFITVYCQHCGYSTNLKTFLSEFFPTIYADYLAEERSELLSDLKSGTLFQKEKQKSEINTVINLQYKFNLNKKYFRPAKAYRESVEFCKKRHILEHIDKLYYNVHPNHALSGMIIFPFVLEDQKTLYALQGRHCGKKLFHTHSKNESMKVYNLFNVNLKEPVYIFESIIDSLMVDNSIAMLGTSLSVPVSNMIKQKVYVNDNDNVGKANTLQYLTAGHKCFIFPKDFKYKDFNEAVCDGFKKEQMPRFLKENTFSGLEGITRIKFQMMGKR